MAETVTKKIKIGTIGLEALATLLAILFFFPFYVLIVSAFKTQAEMTRSPMGLPESFYIQNFVDAFQQAALGPAFMSSTIILAVSVVFLVFACSFAAYTLTRRLNWLTKFWFFIVVGGMVLPLQLAMVPLYRLMAGMGLLGSPLSLIIFHCGVHVPFTVFLYAGFLRAVPHEYEEAAWIDGANDFWTFVYVIFPMLRPITGTVVILNAVSIWNDFLTPLLYLSGSPHRTVPVAVYAFVGQYVANWGLVFAGLLMAALPILAVYFVLQRYIIAGFAGGLKG